MAGTKVTIVSFRDAISEKLIPRQKKTRKG